MDIVDSQVHLNVSGMEGGLAAMRALGIGAVLIDEYDGAEGRRFRPYVMPAGDAPRPVQPLAEDAARRHPEQLAYLIRVDSRDPDLDALARLARPSPAPRRSGPALSFPMSWRPSPTAAIKRPSRLRQMTASRCL